MWRNIRYRIIAELSCPASEDIDKTSQPIYMLVFKPANFR